MRASLFLLIISPQLCPAQPDFTPIMIVRTLTERTLTLAIDSLEHDAWTAEALQFTAPLVDALLHIQDHWKFASAESEHLGLEFPAPVTALPLHPAPDFEHSA